MVLCPPFFPSLPWLLFLYLFFPLKLSFFLYVHLTGLHFCCSHYSLPLLSTCILSFNFRSFWLHKRSIEKWQATFIPFVIGKHFSLHKYCEVTRLTDSGNVFPLSPFSISNDSSAGCYSNVNFIVRYGRHMSCRDLYNEINADSDTPPCRSHCKITVTGNRRCYSVLESICEHTVALFYWACKSRSNFPFR